MERGVERGVERGRMEKGGMRMGDEGWNAKGLEGEGTLQSMRWLQPLTLIVLCWNVSRAKGMFLLIHELSI